MKNILFITLCLFTCIACENEIPFNIKDNSPKLIINALLDADKEENEINIGMTGREEATLIDDALVDIYINGELKQQFTASSKKEPWDPSGKYITNLSFSPQDIIRIEARTKNGSHYAYGETVIPTAIPIEKIDTFNVLRDYYWNYSYYLNIKMTFTDNGTGKNYYRIKCNDLHSYYGKSVYTENDTAYIANYPRVLDPTKDIVLTDGRPIINGDWDILQPEENQYGIFDNSRLNGTYTMTTGTYYTIPPSFEGISGTGEVIDVDKYKNDLEIKLLSICKDHYFYLKALNIYNSQDYDEYFSQPVKFYSNVKEGTGIVGSSIGTSYIINLSELRADSYYE